MTIDIRDGDSRVLIRTGSVMWVMHFHNMVQNSNPLSLSPSFSLSHSFTHTQVKLYTDSMCNLFFFLILHIKWSLYSVKEGNRVKQPQKRTRGQPLRLCPSGDPVRPLTRSKGKACVCVCICERVCVCALYVCSTHLLPRERWRRVINWAGRHWGHICPILRKSEILSSLSRSWITL